jgi:hypothetical protein
MDELYGVLLQYQSNRTYSVSIRTCYRNPAVANENKTNCLWEKPLFF